MKTEPTPELLREERIKSAIHEVTRAYCAGGWMAEHERHDLVAPAEAYANGDKDAFLKSYFRYKSEADNPEWPIKFPAQWRHSHDLTIAMEKFMRIVDEG